MIFEFAKNGTVKERAEFLKRVYKGGSGFRIDGREYAVWFAKDGIRICRGRSAEYSNAAGILPWEDAAARIDALLESGSFAVQSDLDKAESHIRAKTAELLLYIHRDMSATAKDRGYLPSLSELPRSYPDGSARLAEMLGDPETGAAIAAEYREFLEAYKADRSLMRFGYHRMDEMTERLEDLGRPRRAYGSILREQPSAEQFITDDDIDSTFIANGSGVSGGKKRIYAYFTENRSEKEQAEFLKNEYGIGGRSHAIHGASGSWEGHSAAGIKLMKASCIDVFVSWPKAAERIRRLIKEGRYLAPEERKRISERAMAPDAVPAAETPPSAAASAAAEAAPTEPALSAEDKTEGFLSYILPDMVRIVSDDKEYRYSCANDSEADARRACREAVKRAAASYGRENKRFADMYRTDSAFVRSLREAVFSNTHSAIRDAETGRDKAALYEPMPEQETTGQDKDTFSIYQLKCDDATTDIRFMGMDWLNKKGVELQYDNYDLAYTGALTAEGTQIDKLESIYKTFNIDHPADFKGHSLSVSDIVVLHQNGQDTAHYVDSIGFKDVPEFLQQEKTVQQWNGIDAEITAAVQERQQNEPLPSPLDPSVQPVVTIIWSESDQLQEGEQMPLARADALFKSLDETRRMEREQPGYDGSWYDKTKFRIDFTFHGEADSYEGRQDFGDGNGSLIDHIQAHHEYYSKDESYKNSVIRNEGAESWTQEQAEREMILSELVPYMRLHCNLYEQEHTAADMLENILESGAELTPEQTAYFNAVMSYVDACREKLNAGEYALPDPPQFADFAQEAAEMEAYKDHVREEIAQEAAAAGMTATEYAANGYDPREQPAEERAKQLINDFCIKEYYSPADFSDLNSVEIVYTEVSADDGRVLPVQVSVSFDDYSISRYIGDTLIDKTMYDSLERLAYEELEVLDFDSLTSFTDEEVERAFEADTAALLPAPDRGDLVERLTNGNDMLGRWVNVDGTMYVVEDYIRLAEEVFLREVVFETGVSAEPERIRLGEKRVRELLETPAFLSDELILPMLANAYFTQGHDTEDITGFFAEHSEQSERVSFLKEAFGEAYCEVLVGADKHRCGYKGTENSLIVWDGAYSSSTAESGLSWAVVERIIQHMIELGRFTPGIDAPQLTVFERAEVAEAPASDNIRSDMISDAAAQESASKLQDAPEAAMGSSPTVREIYEYYLPIVRERVLEDQAYRNACVNSDRENAYLEGDAAIKRAVSAIEDAKFINLYYGLGGFHNNLHRDVLDGTYPVLSAVAEQAAPETASDQRDQPAYVYNVGNTVYLDDTAFVITKIGRFSVQLRDPAPAYPIFRTESKKTFHHLLEQDERNARYMPNMPYRTVAQYNVIEQEQTASADSEPTFDEVLDSNPISVQIGGRWRTFPNAAAAEEAMNEAHTAPAVNYRITDAELGVGGPKAKYAMNVNALRTLKQIEGEDRGASAEEQEILSRYVGWGGIPDVFDESKENWRREYNELRELLTDEEYESARASTLNAHYTSPTVISAMYDCLSRMGFTNGNILEPSCAVGNFFGLLPESMRGSRLYGVELDSITGRIAKLLYPEADIQVKGYEKTDFKNDFFDLAIGNVPFGQYQVNDREYNRLGFSIHDYFMAKTLDKVRPGGVVAFVTSRYTMDKQSVEVRKYIAQRAELLGAIRLPNNAFKANAGTEVVSDIIFLQKREHPIGFEPEWVHLGQNEDGFSINSYFIDHPEMILGRQTSKNTQYGRRDFTVAPLPDAELADQLRDAVKHIRGRYVPQERPQTVSAEVTASGEAPETIDAEPGVRSYSFTAVHDHIYFNDGTVMHRCDLKDREKERIIGLMGIRDAARRLIDKQLAGCSNTALKAAQTELNELYDDFVAEYGHLNHRENKRLFNDDSSYPLLCSLERQDEEGRFAGKAAIFTKRTVRPNTPVFKADTASEALAVSIAEHGVIDWEYMQELTGKPAEALRSELRGVVFLNPATGEYESSDEYLSGNVRQKLKTAKQFNTDDRYAVNIEALEKVLPEPLDVGDIYVNLGAPWIPSDVIEDFILDVLNPIYYARNRIWVEYSGVASEWHIEGKTADRYNAAIAVEYGTKRMNALHILERTLNLRDVRVYDTVQDAAGNEKRVLNENETILAQQKQQLLKDKFADWIWSDPHRRKRLLDIYNVKFNSTRLREYDGSHLRFPGMNPEIEPAEHQRNAAARIIYGGNTLLAHEVGAGKTFTTAAAAMESKRMGLSNKNMFVVPNHLTEQWGAEFLRLYPGANVLVATEKDFTKENRRKFCARIATGDYDAVIIGHTQFERIPMSAEWQKKVLEEDLNETLEEIGIAKYSQGQRFSVKQLARSRKTLEARLAKLNEQITSRQDDVVTFEELGIDRLFVDEAHGFKNLYMTTKMQNVAGLSQSAAQKSSDLYSKCRYMDEKTDGKGVIFATGTPVSNSMVEMYTMQRYLQRKAIAEHGFGHFDAWAATFGKITEDMELKPEGTGYRLRTRLANYNNLPELMRIYGEVADIKTADMLNLPTPEVEYHNIALKPSEFQKAMIQALAERADKIRCGGVDAHNDNMLAVTNDGRKIALDQRLAAENIGASDTGKVAVCAEQVHRVWLDSTPTLGTQLVFCDLSTPCKDKFNVYDALKAELVGKGIPPNQIAYIHDADTAKKKDALFAKVRSGKVRVLIGSTAKMGAGTNVQKRLVALHHLDCPWRPADLEQREGRILRQGNENQKVDIFRYVTEGTFDAYLWQIIESKLKFIKQVMTSRSAVRSCEDIDEAVLTAAEVKALATDNPYIKEKMELDVEVSRLRLLKSAYLSERCALEDKAVIQYPRRIARLNEEIKGIRMDIDTADWYGSEFTSIVVNGHVYDERSKAGDALMAAINRFSGDKPVVVGSFKGFDIALSFQSIGGRLPELTATLRGHVSHHLTLGTDGVGNIRRIENAIKAMPDREKSLAAELDATEQNRKAALEAVAKPFAYEAEFLEKSARLVELNALLASDSREQTVREQPEAMER